MRWEAQVEGLGYESTKFNQTGLTEGLLREAGDWCENSRAESQNQV